MKTALFLGAGRHQRAAILRAKELGYRVAAADGNPDAIALPDADVAEVVNFTEIPKAIELGRRTLTRPPKHRPRQHPRAR